MAEINVTPMVDVMLVLLIIFMVSAPLLTVGRADRPAADARPRRCDQDSEPLTVSVNVKGEVFLQETEIPVEELVPKLKAITEARGGVDERIYVRGDRQVDYGTVMKVMGRISAAGFRRVALVTEIEQGRRADRRDRRGYENGLHHIGDRARGRVAVERVVVRRQAACRRRRARRCRSTSCPRPSSPRSPRATRTRPRPRPRSRWPRRSASRSRSRMRRAKVVDKKEVKAAREPPPPPPEPKPAERQARAGTKKAESPSPIRSPRR